MGFEIKKFRDQIKEVDWEKSSAPNTETEEGIDDYGDYVVIDNFFLLKPDDIMVGYDRASMTRMISTSVRIGSLV